MNSSLSYKSSGVDTEKARNVVRDIAALRTRTEKTHQLYQAFGLFAAGYDLSAYQEPVIFTACDGVGTKIRLLLDYNRLETAGIDLVAMNVNDILCCNAMPLLFLDYIGIGQLDAEKISRIISGVVGALEGCYCILAGGETAEMPGLVHDDMIELSGFCVGAAEKKDIVDISKVQPGDVLIGIPSNGFHANGWSLVRKILATYPEDFSKSDILDLLTPTRIYYPEVKALNEAGIEAHAMAHITGGGLRENLERVLNGCGAEIELPEWNNPSAQKVMEKVDLKEAIHAFNMGIGFVFILPPEIEKRALEIIKTGIKIGYVAKGNIKIKLNAFT